MTMMETEIDVTLVAGRRPELLRRTLASFRDMCFGNFRIANVFVNVDPFGGDAEDADTCKDVVLEHFPSAEVLQPDTASYGQAVKTLWSMVRSPYALHLEDDWIALEDISPERIYPMFTASRRTAMVSFVDREKNWNGRSLRATYLRRIAWTPFKLRRPRVTVSPGFIERSFAHGYAKLMNPEIDPEKQARGGYNPPLTKYVDGFEFLLLPSAREGEIHVIEDIGREWRERHGVEKVNRDGRAYWITQGPPAKPAT